jgi:hypothetical protein
MRKVVLLVGGTLLFWLLVALPARWLGGGDLALMYALTAVLLCLIPAAGTLLWADATFRRQPEMQGLVFMGGMVLRMFFVVIATTVLYARVEFFQLQEGFVIWVCVFYLFVLALETSLFTVGRISPPVSPGASRPSEPHA